MKEVKAKKEKISKKTRAVDVLKGRKKNKEGKKKTN